MNPPSVDVPDPESEIYIYTDIYIYIYRYVGVFFLFLCLSTSSAEELCKAILYVRLLVGQPPKTPVGPISDKHANT